MSYTVESKKRKFHRVLDSLATAASTSTPSPSLSTPSRPSMPTGTGTGSASDRDRIGTGVAHSTIKRVRLTSDEEARQRSGASSSPPASISISVSGSASASPSAAAGPNYVPWDRERFLRRLETFRRVDRWVPKPAAINEVAWAKRGWSCVGVERLACVGGCERAVVVKLPDELDEDKDEAGGGVEEDYEDEKERATEKEAVGAQLVDKYAKLIVDAHGDKCPWRRRGCDDAIQRLPLTNPSAALSGLRSRYHHLNRLGSKIPPEETLEISSDLDLDEVIRLLPADFTAPESTESPTSPSPSTSSNAPTLNRPALLFAISGWDSTPTDLPTGLASCTACFRRLGLWLYTPTRTGADTVTDIDSTPIYSRLDIFSEHLEYCPWINRDTQSGTVPAKPAATSISTGLLHDQHRCGWESLVHGLRTLRRRHDWSAVPQRKPAGDAISSQKDGDPTEAGKQQGEQQEDQGVQAEGNQQEGEEEEEQLAAKKDREWWAKLRRVRQALQVRGLKKPAAAGRRQD